MPGRDVAANGGWVARAGMVTPAGGGWGDTGRLCGGDGAMTTSGPHLIRTFRAVAGGRLSIACRGMAKSPVTYCALQCGPLRNIISGLRARGSSPPVLLAAPEDPTASRRCCPGLAAAVLGVLGNPHNPALLARPSIVDA
jgi:hypothetical protein